MTEAITPFTLFGASKPWLPPPWTTTDDRVRGGASQSYLSSLPNDCARFYGHLDTSTLGGAGFASQFNPTDAAADGSWDLSAYDGIEIVVIKGGGKVYTLILKDEFPLEKRDDGRGKAGVNWEVEFRAGKEDGETTEKSSDSDKSKSTTIWVPWEMFKATHRGKEKKDAGELNKGDVKRIGIMMRSYFGKQKGNFSIDLKSIRARKVTSEDVQRTAFVSMRGTEERSWSRNVFSFCAIL